MNDFTLDDLEQADKIYSRLVSKVEKAPPALKGTRDSYLVVGGKIPAAFYDEREKEWYKFSEIEQVYKCRGIYGIFGVLNFFEKAKFRPFYNDEQIKAFCKDKNIFYV